MKLKKCLRTLNVALLSQKWQSYQLKVRIYILKLVESSFDLIFQKFKVHSLNIGLSPLTDEVFDQILWGIKNRWSINSLSLIVTNQYQFDNLIQVVNNNYSIRQLTIKVNSAEYIKRFSREIKGKLSPYRPDRTISFIRIF